MVENEMAQVGRAGAKARAAEAKHYARLGAEYAIKKHGLKQRRYFPWKPKRSPSRCQHCQQWFDRPTLLAIHAATSNCGRRQKHLAERAKRRASQTAQVKIEHQDIYDKVLGKPKSWSLAYALRNPQAPNP